VSLSGGGVLKFSKKQDQTQQFLRFIIGKKGARPSTSGRSEVLEVFQVNV